MTMNVPLWARPFVAVFAIAVISLPTSQVVFAAADDEELIVEEVVVTGSRIKRDDFSSASPITVISGEAILESGFGDLGEALRNTVNAGTAGFNQSAILSGGGSTSVDLRNLGQSRVLVLINGKRVASFADALANQAIDLTFVPNALVERVDILRDGASAIYGSDAISGVVNIILKEGFEGVQTGASHSISGEGDAEYYSADFAIGTTSDRGSIMIGGEYRYQNNLPQRERDWAIPTITSLTSGGTNNGSFFHPGGIFLGDTTGIFCTRPKAFGGDEITDVTATGGCPSLVGQSSPDELARYDYALEQDILTHYKILSTAAYGTYELFEGVESFLEVQYSKRRSNFRLDGNPSGFGTPGVPNGWTVPATNPNNPTGDNGLFLIRPSSTIGIRDSFAESDTVRVVAGLRGDVENDGGLLDGWSWELSWLYTRVDADLRTNSVYNLLRAVTISDPALCADDLICSTVVNPSGALDVFRPGNWTQEEIEYMRQNTLATNEFQTSGWFGMITGPLFELPAGEVQVALGFETRTDEGFSKPDSVTEAGESVANQVFTTDGSFTVDEFFAEIDIPLLTDAPFAQSLDLNAQFRISDYSTFGSEDVYRLGLNWQITDDVRLRATMSTAYRAPQVTDLFGGGTVSFDFFTHPCSDPNAAGTVAANCALAGIPLGTPQAGGGQYAVLAGSNPELQPETADTSTIGLVFTPSFLEGFSLSIDYWDIEVKDLINRSTSDSIVDTCYDSAGLSAPECSQFRTTLLPSGGLVIRDLINRLSNQDKVSTDGYDVGMRYEFEGFADTFWTLDFQGTYVKENTFYPGQGGADDRGSIPRIRGNLNARVDWDMWDFSWRTRYVHRMKDPRFDGNNVLNYDGPGSHTEHDLRVGYNWNDKYRAVVGVNDVFDNDPPFIFSTGNNTDLFLYGSVGRSFFLRLSANL